MAAGLFIGLALVVAAFQVAVASGAPLGQLTWGGAFPGRLPMLMRGVAAGSAVLLVAFACIVAIRAGILWPAHRPLASRLVWGVVGYSALAIVANAITPSPLERMLWLPVVSVMFVSSLLVARGR